MRTFFLVFTFTISTVGCAYAHWGHLGDVAGHAHWLGVGAVVAAGVLGAILGKGLRKPDEETTEEPAAEADEGEVA